MRVQGEHESSRRLKTEMLVQMEGCDPKSSGCRVLLVGATNRPEVWTECVGWEVWGVGEGCDGPQEQWLQSAVGGGDKQVRGARRRGGGGKGASGMWGWRRDKVPTKGAAPVSLCSAFLRGRT